GQEGGILAEGGGWAKAGGSEGGQTEQERTSGGSQSHVRESLGSGPAWCQPVGSRQWAVGRSGRHLRVRSAGLCFHTAGSQFKTARSDVRKGSEIFSGSFAIWSGAFAFSGGRIQVRKARSTLPEGQSSRREARFSRPEGRCRFKRPRSDSRKALLRF